MCEEKLQTGTFKRIDNPINSWPDTKLTFYYESYPFLILTMTPFEKQCIASKKCQKLDHKTKFFLESTKMIQENN